MKRLLLGMVVTFVLVLGSNLLTWRTTGLSYDHFTWAAYAGPGVMYPEHEDEVPGGCTDGEDNDLDDDIDCADEDCFDEVPCINPAPTLSPLGIGALMSMLLLIGLYGLLRRQRANN